MTNFDFSELTESVCLGDRSAAVAFTKAALEAGLKPMVIIEQGLIPGMQKLGDDFSKGEVYLPEMLIGAEAMKACLTLVKPLLKSEEVRLKGTIVIGTVLGDVHDIGKNIVAWMLEGAGFNIIDLGVDVPPEKFIEAIKKENPQILGLSALLTTSTHQIGALIDLLKNQGLRDKVKIIIGGASVDQNYANRVGADGYAPDAVSAIGKAKELTGMVP
jgi:5-methyltetrahydrofolate--homocysteine methyltransferase